ncbi:MAG: hypothetical protein LAT68_09325 [Cyclobacteriaceae bacterium]|nr:hypothetical protein [Cyclobacteriaceae bacterium]MCH8516514.1 hypothetical protein [Cyclobacteriaceae bacterium]
MKKYLALIVLLFIVGVAFACPDHIYVSEEFFWDAVIDAITNCADGHLIHITII